MAAKKFVQKYMSAQIDLLWMDIPVGSQITNEGIMVPKLILWWRLSYILLVLGDVCISAYITETFKQTLYCYQQSG